MTAALKIDGEEDGSLLKKIGQNLRKLREKNELSQLQLAIFSDTDRSYLAEVEEGKANPSMRFLYKLLRILKTKTSVLFE